MANIEFDLKSLCQQRKKRTELIKSMELFKNRYEPINPYIAYPQNTRYDFDMRFKECEISDFFIPS